ncbi:MAG: hypothetical protein FWF47_04630, partial [Clostridia bacterium]|nr:hypothetical protein [Clostridia bacterium]
RIIGSGLLPFFEISLCPPELKSGDTTLTHYKANTSVPYSFERWVLLIKEIICHCLDRYGMDCVKNWFFEVWNEPDLEFLHGDILDYFTIYDHTVLAIKSVCKELRVGGPATSKCEWIDAFITHIEKGSSLSMYQPLPCDFISTHAYPSDIDFINSDSGDVELRHSSIMLSLFTNVKQKMRASSLKNLPLIMGEWNSSAGPLSFNHDERNNAAFIVKIINELKDVIDGSLYWNLSDIYEECGFHFTPFHGGYGLFNVNSIPKSSFNAFLLLNELNGYELVVEKEYYSPERGILTTYDDASGVICILLYNYTEPGSDNPTSWDLKLVLNGVTAPCIPYQSTEINEDYGSAFEWWKSVGSPEYLTTEAHTLLVDKAKMETQIKILQRNRNPFIQWHETIHPGNVKLIKLLNIYDYKTLTN